jgi:8-oxo-dGTP diphosphatase
MEIKFQKELDSFKKLGFLNPLNLSEDDISLLPIKYSIRTIILLENKKIVIIKSENKYHTVVGGGIEEGENIDFATIRESKEESGYDIEVITSLGYLEYFKKNGRHFDFGFLVKAIGLRGEIKLTDEEIKFGHEVIECTLEEAILILENEAINNDSQISLRSLIFVKEAKTYLENVLK